MWHCVFGYVNVQCTCICNSAGESSTSLPVLLTEAYCKDSNADRNTQGLGKNLPTHHKKRNTALCVGYSYRKFYH